MSTELTIPTQQAASILSVIERAATDPATDVSKMERLLSMAFQIRASDSESAFYESMNSAQGEMTSISKDCFNPQTRSKYSSYQNIDEVIRPIYTRHGFAMSFGSKSSPHGDHVIVTCRVSHKAGHKEEHELDVPADGKGLKGGDMMTKTHAMGSALTYAKRYLAGLIWNLSFGETDDDGNGASPRTQATAPRTQSESLPMDAGETKWLGVKVSNCESKSGTSGPNKKPWTLYNITFEDGRTAGTFSESLFKTAESFSGEDSPLVDATVKPGRKEGTVELVAIEEADNIPN